MERKRKKYKRDNTTIHLCHDPRCQWTDRYNSRWFGDWEWFSDKMFQFCYDWQSLVKRGVFQFTGEAEGVAEDIEISICVLLCNLQAVLVGKSQIYFFMFQTIELRLPFIGQRVWVEMNHHWFKCLVQDKKRLHINDTSNTSNSVSVSKNVICLLQWLVNTSWSPSRVEVASPASRWVLPPSNAGPWIMIQNCTVATRGIWPTWWWCPLVSYLHLRCLDLLIQIS